MVEEIHKNTHKHFGSFYQVVLMVICFRFAFGNARVYVLQSSKFSERNASYLFMIERNNENRKQRIRDSAKNWEISKEKHRPLFRNRCFTTSKIKLTNVTLKEDKYQENSTVFSYYYFGILALQSLTAPADLMRQVSEYDFLYYRNSFDNVDCTETQVQKNEINPIN
uniref:Uncharacterized protein n=1 Tax=Glossina austeni TaxID=7395 RepID=A0A1A9VTR6_GLOAU